MILQKLINNYAAYNTWANQTFVSWLKTLNKNIITQHTPSSFPTIDLTLQHILRTQKFWHLFVLQRDIQNFNWAVRPNEELVIMEELLENSTLIAQDFKKFDENDLQEILHLNMPWAKNNLSRYEYIVHLINHGTFHRGQIVTMARNLGVTTGIPPTDYNIFNCL